MTLEIVILNTSTNQSDGSYTLTGVFWLVPSGNFLPLPNFKSQVPFIDASDLAALQTGQLVEQSFNTGAFPSGTDLATAQSYIQSLYTTAQTNLTGQASPLTGIIGNVYDSGSGWSTSNPFTPFSSLIAVGNLSALNSVVQVSMFQYNSVGAQIAAGTFAGVIVAETSFDNGITWNQTYFSQVGSGNKQAVIVNSNPSPAGAYSIVMNGGVGLARVRAFSWTSGSCAITLRASNIFDEALDMDISSPGSAVPPSASIAGAAVNTSAPTYTNGTANFLSLNTSGGLRVDGSGVIQPASQSGTWTVQPGNTANTTPWLSTVSQGGLSAGVTAKGTQSTNALNVQEFKDAGRTAFCAVATGLAGVTSETLVTLTPIRGVTAGGTGTSLAVTAGKTLRLQTLVLTVRNTTAVQTSAIIRVRMLAGTVLVNSQVFFALSYTAGSAVSGGCSSMIIDLPDGFEISGTTQVGITQLASATTAALDISLIGFEY